MLNYYPSTTVDLTPTASPNPLDAITPEGQSASFSSGCVGGDTPTVGEWQVSTDGGSTWADTGITATTLVISNAQLTQSGYQYRFRCTDSDGDQAFSAPATLTVTPVSANISGPLLLGAGGFVTQADFSGADS